MSNVKCPNCGKNLKEVIYGLPSAEILEQVKKGEVVLGGCEIIEGIDQEAFLCHDCNKKYTKDLKECGPVYEIDEKTGEKIYSSNFKLDASFLDESK